MGWLSWFFFESAFALGGVLFVTNFALLVYWRRGNSPRPLLVTMAFSVLLLAVQALVVTPREHAKRLLAVIEADLLAEKTEGLAGALSADFRAFDLPAAEFVRFVYRRYDLLDLTWLRRTRFEVLESGEGGLTVELNYLADVQSRDYRGTFPSRWRAEFVQTPAGWKLRAAEALSPTWRTIRSAR